MVSPSEPADAVLEALDTLGMDRDEFRVDNETQEGHATIYIGDVRLLVVHRKLQVPFEDLHCDVPVAFCLSAAPRKDQDVIRIADDLDTLRLHRLVEHIQIDVAQQRRDHPTLGAANLRLLPRSIVHYASLEKQPNQVENS